MNLKPALLASALLCHLAPALSANPHHPDLKPAITLIEEALNNPLLAENFPEISEKLRAQTQNRLTPQEIITLARALCQEENPIHQKLLTLLIENSALTEENRQTLLLLTQTPPLHKTPRMKMLEKKIETAKTKLACEPYAQNLLGKSPSFEHLQFLLLINQETPENLKALEEAAQCAIQNLGTLPTQPRLRDGEPMSWTPSPSQTQRQQNVVKAAYNALLKAQKKAEQAPQKDPEP